ncbi:SGNH/GDSL hydrolase family protein [Curtobacterium aurantiacum]|uniref:SGNH/GDSL hydrolase family protein n=1 Tax=Curtobacterium aurantiacum TaxID=3236919 RepID=UPI001BE01A80|nr:SGNH/GDSL hydrolase family protein [Curtobacterium flaccumfaciens]MBT1676797.1 hypothetical protein [Curtobacterium flaccumfaciens pv. flaccumfaciens]
MGSPLLVSVDSDTKQLPAAVRAVQAANLSDPSTVEGTALSALQPKRTSVFAGRSYGFLGDSITNGSSASNFAYSFSSQAVQMAGHLIALPGFVEAGVSGQTSAQMLARLPQFIASGIDAAVLLAGTNDATQGVSIDQYASNITQIITSLRKAGIPTIVVTVPPRGSSTVAAIVAATDGYNTWLRIHVPLLGARLADAHSGLVDATNGYLKSSYDSGDGTHPNNAGHQVIATAVARQMRDASPSRKPRGLVMGKTATNLVDDPLSNRASAASWFELTGNNTGVTTSFAVDTSGELPAGRWTQWEFDATTAGGFRRFTIPTVTPPAAGTRLVVTAHVQVEDVAGGWEAHVADGSASLGLTVLNANSGAAIAAALQRTVGIRRADAAAVYDIGPVVFPFDMPAGVTAMSLVFYLTLPTGDRVRLRTGAVGVLNATALGLAAEFTYPIVPVNSPA